MSGSRSERAELQAAVAVRAQPRVVRRDPQHWTALGGPGVALTVSRAWFSYHPFRKSGLSACATKPAEPGADTQVPQETLETAAAVR